jgi:hypothetical protein
LRPFSIKISKCLSITYSPRHRYDFDSGNLKLFNNEGNEINLPTNNDFLRVWPAFGKYGGGIEVLVKLNESEITPSSENILLNGGEFDRFHRDAILVLADQILESINKGVVAIFEIGEEGIGLSKNGLPVYRWKKMQTTLQFRLGLKKLRME